MKKNKRLVFIIIISLLVLAVVGFGLFLYLKNSTFSAPEIIIIEPAEDAQVLTGDYLYLKTQSWSSRGIDRVEFSVDGALYRHQLATDEPPLEMVANFSWMAETAGTYDLSFTAFDAQGSPSQPAALVVTVVEEAARSDEIAAGEQQSGAGSGASQSDGAGSDANADGNGAQGIQGDAPGDNGQDGAELGNGDALLQDARPDIRLVDFSTRQGDGLLIQVRAIAEDDDGLVSISIGIDSGDGNPENREILCGGLPLCEHLLTYQLNAGDRLVSAVAHDTSGQASEVALLQFMVAAAEGDEAPALVVGQDFNPGDIQLAAPEQEEEQLDDFGAPRITGYDCGGNLVKIGIPYRYYSNHGRQVYATAWVEQDSELIAAGWVPVEYSTSGLVQLEMDTRESVEDGLITDRIKLRFMNDPTSGEAFYTEEADLTISWPTPKPDLLITGVDRSISGDSVEVTVQNIGCEDVDGFDLFTATSTGAGSRRESYPDTVPANSSKKVTVRFLDPNLYSNQFEVEVDPDNTIDEIDENNNVFQKLPIRIKYIHFYRIDIHNTSDGEWYENARQGEFRIYAYAHDQREIRPSNNLDITWRMEKGSHDIDGIINPIKLYPDINSDQPLVLLVDLEEDDTFAPNDWDKMVFTHSADMNDVNSWKRGHGHDFSATSSNGWFTMHWWIVLEE